MYTSWPKRKLELKFNHWDSGLYFIYIGELHNSKVSVGGIVISILVFQGLNYKAALASLKISLSLFNL
jgi:hypothetical protein